MLRETVEAWEQAASSGKRIEEAYVLTGQYTLGNLANDLAECESLTQIRVLEVLSLCLKRIDRIDQGPQDEEPIQHLANHAAGFLHNPAASYCVDSLALAETALDVLRSLVVGFSAQLGQEDLIRVTAYTNNHDTWTTSGAASSAEDILRHSLNDDTRRKFIESTVLEHFIRPIFSRATSSRITSTGRKAFFIDDDKNWASQSAINATQPWKTTQIHAITVFNWAVEHADESLVSKCWPLFTPVLLALMDDTETKFKRKGLLVLHNFVLRCPARLLGDTGLGEIFQQSVFPSLLSLPGSTPEDESLQLLVPAYNAIMQLAEAQFPDDEARPQKTKLLVKLLTEGILAGYWHASEYIRIVELLAQQIIPIVHQLGQSAIPHMKAGRENPTHLCPGADPAQELLSMVSAIMTDPFLVSRPTCIQAAAQALAAIMLNCWPRIADASHLGVVLRMISICWLNVLDEHMRMPGSVANGKALEEVSRLAHMLQAILIAAGLTPHHYFSPLLAAEPRLAKLFADVEAAKETVGKEDDASQFSRVAAA